MIAVDKYKKDNEIAQQAIEKCWEDEAFKKQFMAQPVEAIKEHFNYDFVLPEGVRVEVCDLTDTTKSYLPLHAEPNWEELELSDEQLEMVAGGDVTVSVVVTYITLGVTIAAAGYIAGRIWG